MIYPVIMVEIKAIVRHGEEFGTNDVAIQGFMDFGLPHFLCN